MLKTQLKAKKSNHGNLTFNLRLLIKNCTFQQTFIIKSMKTNIIEELKMLTFCF